MLIRGWRLAAAPASPVRHQQPFATNNRSTSAAARRPPAALQSAAQAAGAARAPRRSISHAHRSPQARAGQSERCHKPPQRSCLNRGAVAHHPLARAASAAPSRARARNWRHKDKRRPADFSAPCFGEHPVAEPRGAAGGRSSKYHQHRCRRVAASVVLVAHAAARMSPCGGECRVGRTLPRGGPSSPAHAGAGAAPIRARGAAGGRSSKYHQHRCRRVAASVVLVAHAAARMSPCGGECRVGRSRCRADVAVWRRVSCWSHAAARWPVVAGARRRRRGADSRQRQHRPFATNNRSPPTTDRRRPPRGGRPLPYRAPHRRLAQLAHPAGRSRMLIALHRLAPVKASDAISPLNAVV